jgi:hypothetical protein
MLPFTQLLIWLKYRAKSTLAARECQRTSLHNFTKSKTPGPPDDSLQRLGEVEGKR